MLDGEGRIVVAVGGRARHLLPTGLPRHLADSLEALVEIGRGGAARNHAVGPRVGLRLDQHLAQGPPQILVVSADIGLSRRARRVGVEGDDRNSGFARRLDDADRGTDVGDRDRQAVDPLRD